MTVTPGTPAPEALSPLPSEVDAAEQERAVGHLATRQICPFLTIEGGGWRSSSPSRDHRCGAVTPAVPLAIEKQRRLCLADTHVACATYLAATGASPSGDMGVTRAALGRPGPAATPTVTRWSLVRTVPVVLDRNRVPASVGSIVRDRRGGQLLLAGLLFAAIAALAVARLSGGGSSQGGALASNAPSPSAAVASSPVATAAPTPEPSVEPTAAPTTPPPTTTPPSPTPAASHRTYTVRSGDTLTQIAARFGTTIDAIVELNNLKNRNILSVGQVLLIP